jgi:hypothetical protein
MALRKCPACKNPVDAESESCPVCGCEARGWWVRSFVVACGAVGVALVWVAIHHHHVAR